MGNLCMMLLLLCGASALLIRKNTTDVQLGVLGPNFGELVSFMQKAEADRLQDRKTADLRYEATELMFKSLQQSIDQDKKTADVRYEAAELRFKSLQQSIDQISDAVVTETTSDRVYACARLQR